MEQYAVYENKGGGKAAYPFLLNIQHPLADGFNHTVMVPLVPLEKLDAFPPKKTLPLIASSTSTLCGNDTHAGWRALERNWPVY
jgi:toxin CcdB